MRRRQAIIRISMTGVGALAALGGYETYSLFKGPDFGFLEASKALLAALGETIIPTTDTPGAKEAGIPEFAMGMIRNCTPITEQNSFIDGLKKLQKRCQSKYGKVYEDCNSAEQHVILAHFEQKGTSWSGIAGKIERKLTGRSFFAILKDLTVEGYCTSLAGATHGLAYQYIPAQYQGCIPLQPAQKAWATN